jgi:uncharacterized protein (TIGR02145 family)
MIAFIFKSSLILLILYGLYWFLLRKEKLFVFNRYFLILSVIFSLIVPFISIPINVQESQNLGKIVTTLDYNIPYINPVQDVITNNINSVQPISEVRTTGIDTSTVLIIVYFSGVMLFLLRFLKNIYSIFYLIKLSEKISFNGHNLVLTDIRENPYCFFNYIFINREDFKNLKTDDQLLIHEHEHIRQYHSIDIVFIELIKIFYWFNPFYLLFDRAIRINHEYLADHRVILDDHDIKSYSEKLLGFIFTRSNFPLTSGSNQSFIKKRLLMMTKSRSKSIYYGLRITVAFSAILVFFFLLSFKRSIRESDSSGLFAFQPQTVKDIDGNVYKTVNIGNQTWMAENLKTSRYNDGRKIPLVTDTTQWQKYEPAFCWYNNDEKTNKEKYGALYNWYAVNTNKLCPVGWHVPNSEELSSLVSFSYKDTLTAGSMKEIGTVHWRIPNKGATNETGFSARPGGYRGQHAAFECLSEQGIWWISTEENEYIGRSWMLNYDDSRVHPAWPSKRVGFSVRCLMDNTTMDKFSEKGKNGVNENTNKGKIKESVEKNSATLIIPAGKTENLKGKQDTVVSTTSKNVLYRGIANPVEIAITGITSDKVSATMTNGTLKRATYGWDLFPGDENESVVIINVNDKERFEKRFIVKDIPYPVAVFCQKSTGSISRDQASKACFLEAELRDSDLDLKFEIMSFTLAYSKEGFDREIYSNGKMFTDEMKSVVSELTRGKYLVLKDIKAIGPDNKIRDLSPIILKID